MQIHCIVPPKLVPTAVNTEPLSCTLTTDSKLSVPLKKGTKSKKQGLLENSRAEMPLGVCTLLPLFHGFSLVLLHQLEFLFFFLPCLLLNS